MRNMSVILLAGVLLGAEAAAPAAKSIAAERKGKIPAAKSAKKAKSRTLKELIAYAEKHGIDRTLFQKQADDLSFSSRFAAKKIAYVLRKKPHTHTRLFQVVYDDSTLPLALIWSEFKKDVDGEVFSEDMWEYRSTLTGKLERCVHAVGSADAVSQSVVEIDEKVGNYFQDLVSFFLIDAVKLDAEGNK